MSVTFYTEEGFFVVLSEAVGLSVPTPYDIFDSGGAGYGTAAFRDFIGVHFDPGGNYSGSAYDAVPFRVTQPPLDDGTFQHNQVNRHVYTAPDSSYFPFSGDETGLPFRLVFSSPARANATGHVDGDVQPETAHKSTIDFAWGFLTTLPPTATNVTFLLTFHGVFTPATPNSGSGALLGKVNLSYRGGVTNGPDAYPGESGEAVGGIIVGNQFQYFVPSDVAFSGASFFTNYLVLGPEFSYGHPGDEFLIESVTVERHYSVANISPELSLRAAPDRDLVPLITTVVAEVNELVGTDLTQTAALTVYGSGGGVLPAYLATFPPAPAGRTSADAVYTIISNNASFGTFEQGDATATPLTASEGFVSGAPGTHTFTHLTSFPDGVFVIEGNASVGIGSTSGVDAATFLAGLTVRRTFPGVPDPSGSSQAIANTKVRTYAFTTDDGNPPQNTASPTYYCSFRTVGPHDVHCTAHLTSGDTITAVTTVVALPLPVAPPPPAPPPADPPPYGQGYDLSGAGDTSRVDYE